MLRQAKSDSADNCARLRGEEAPVALLLIDPDGMIAEANAEAARLFGCSPEELAGSPAADVLPPGWRDSGRETGAAGGHEHLARRADRSEFPAEIELRPLADGCLVAAVIDVSRRRRAMEALRRESERNRLLIEGITDYSIITLDLDGTVTSWNIGAEHIKGYAAAEIIGQPFTVFYSEEDRRANAPERALKTALQQGKYEAEGWRVRKDGSRFWASVVIDAIRDGKGVLIGFLKITSDITERKRADDLLRLSVSEKERAVAQLSEARERLETRVHERTAELEAANRELLRANHELDDFAYIASHDLKEPLRGLHNYATFLAEDYADKVDDQGRQYIDRMQRLTDRLGTLIDQLLHYSRLGSSALALKAVEPDAVIDSVVADLESFLKQTGVEVRRPHRLPRISCDPILFGELIQNLITNAAKYNDKAEKYVEIDFSGDPDAPVFMVRDNGIGIPEQHREKVFRIFKRLHERDKYGGGTGAGLTIAKKIVERHGGRIWLESTEKVGTTFYFTLFRDISWDAAPAPGDAATKGNQPAPAAPGGTAATPA